MKKPAAKQPKKPELSTTKQQPKEKPAENEVHQFEKTWGTWHPSYGQLESLDVSFKQQKVYEQWLQSSGTGQRCETMKHWGTRRRTLNGWFTLESITVNMAKQVVHEVWVKEEE